MATPNKDALETFDLTSIPTLDTCVLGALEVFEEKGVPTLPTLPKGKTLIVGSGNAAVTAHIFADYLSESVATDESEYRDLMKRETFANVIIISASGAKHAVGIAEYATKQGLTVFLLTHTENSPASAFLPAANVFVFPKNREPYTYNTSTYMGLILALTKESPTSIRTFITEILAPTLNDDLQAFDAYFFTVPTRFRHMLGMVRTKFDELFGSKVSCRAFTVEQAKHATTVVPSDTEFFLSVGEMPRTTQNEKVHMISLPEGAQYGLVMATLYYFIGLVQRQNPQYFKENISQYCEKASSIFGQTVRPIVD